MAVGRALGSVGADEARLIRFYETRHHLARDDRRTRAALSRFTARLKAEGLLD